MSTDDKNMTTQDLIKRLRNLGPLGKIMEELVIVAADRLEELQRELTEAIRERNKTVADLIKQRDEANAEVERLKQQLGDHSKMTHADDLSVQMLTLISGMNAANAPQIRPEPSRLEIAAMLKAGWFANFDNPDALACPVPRWWIEQADALIAAAREGK